MRSLRGRRSRGDQRLRRVPPAADEEEKGSANPSNEKQPSLPFFLSPQQRDRGHDGGSKPRQPEDERPAGQRQRDGPDGKTDRARRKRLFVKIVPQPEPCPFQDRIPM